MNLLPLCIEHLIFQYSFHMQWGDVMKELKNSTATLRLSNVCTTYVLTYTYGTNSDIISTNEHGPQRYYIPYLPNGHLEINNHSLFKNIVHDFADGMKDKSGF